MCKISPLSLTISLLMVATDDGGEPSVKVVRAIIDPKEARTTCDILNAESDRLAGKLDAIKDLLESWSNHNPYPTTGSDEERGDRQDAYQRKEAEFRDIILGANKINEVPFHSAELPHYWIDTVGLS